MTPSEVPEVSLLGDFVPGGPELLIVGFIFLLPIFVVIWVIRMVTNKCSNCQKRGLNSGGFCSRCGASLSEKTPSATQDSE